MKNRYLFILTLFWSAMLLFMMQPLFTRMAVPLLGGAPSVWNIALVFFQFVLLFGYLYAHGLQRLKARTQIIVHLLLLLAAAITLPLDIPGWYPAPSSTSPSLWLIGLLTVAVGLPFFALSAQAPLMQRWFSFSDDPQANDPYFLYAASNIGSMIGLLGYPLFMEPLFGVTLQNILWAGGFVILMLLVARAGYSIWHAVPKQTAINATTAPLPVKQQLHWVALAAVPSGLLVAVSNILTTDIGSLPLLWVLPLAIYLASFVIAFGKSDTLPFHRMHFLVTVTVIVAGLFAYLSINDNIWLTLISMLLPFFIVATACHSKMVEQRPSSAHMTRFYVLMSLGGAIGGSFSSLLAPVIFNWIYEYPILIIAAAALLTSPVVAQAKGRLIPDIINGHRHRRLGDVAMMAFALLLGMSGAVQLVTLNALENSNLADTIVVSLTILAMVVVCFLCRTSALRFAVAVAAAGLVFGGASRIFDWQKKTFQDRSFFGVSSVRTTENASIVILAHGTTIHGAQSLLPATRLKPQTYYAAGSGVGQVMQRLSFNNIGLVGLGSGALSCYVRPRASLTYFEIDPLMISIASNPRLFSYVSECSPNANMVLGDARLQLKNQYNHQAFDLLVIDAFSSDAIPLHLMTTEAFAIYLKSLTADGVLMVHVSNRYFELEPVVAKLVQNSGLHAAMFKYEPLKDQPRGVYESKSNWIAVARTSNRIEQIMALQPGWTPLALKPQQSLWTDDFSSPLAALKMLN
jgi:hypothetical protein